MPLPEPTTIHGIQNSQYLPSDTVKSIGVTDIEPILPEIPNTYSIMSYTIKTPEQGKCLQCGTDIYGRPGKKFCSIMCKNAYHNNLSHLMRKARVDTIKSLNRNYEILKMLMENNIRTIELARIRKMGFDENFITGHSKGLYRHIEEICYDIVYFRSFSKIFNIHRK